MRDDNPHLRSMLRIPAPEPRPSEEDSDLPPESDRQAMAHARPSNKPLYSIHFVNPSGDMHSFQYVHLDSYSSYTSDCITLKFVGMEPVKVTLRGRNLRQLYDYIHQHRVGWIVQAIRDFAQDGEAIITDIRFAKVVLEE